jgi:hypothetical protein
MSKNATPRQADLFRDRKLDLGVAEYLEVAAERELIELAAGVARMLRVQHRAERAQLVNRGCRHAAEQVALGEGHAAAVERGRHPDLAVEPEHERPADVLVVAHEPTPAQELILGAGQPAAPPSSRAVRISRRCAPAACASSPRPASSRRRCGPSVPSPSSAMSIW